MKKKSEFAAREMQLARIFLDGEMTFEQIVKQRKVSKAHMVGEIVFGALFLAEKHKDKRAANLWDLFRQKGMGGIQVIKKYNEKFRKPQARAQIKLVDK